MNRTIRLLLLLSTLIISKSISSQTFTWMHGADTMNHPGVYGTMGVPSATNQPGARFGAVTWTDNNGKLWLFGGWSMKPNAPQNFHNDLWKYDPLTNMWTWMKGGNTINSDAGTQGVPSATNVPGARRSGATWTDNNGNLWLFGGFGYGTGPGGYQSDLWRYNIITNMWTWMKGSSTFGQVGVYGTQGAPSPSNNPGSRVEPASWTDAQGNLWLFGGMDYLGYAYNDLWKYNPASNQWAWMNGSSGYDQPGSYGQQGVTTNTNFPGARFQSIAWKDNNGNLFLYGGANNIGSIFNDVWRYNIPSNQWTWLKGTAGNDVAGSYGSLGVTTVSNNPAGRIATIGWTDSQNNLWIFGGVNSNFYINDTWRYDLASNRWTWVKGNINGTQIGTYGTKGIPASSNIPTGRFYSSAWTLNGEGWLLGGIGDPHMFNDLWKFDNCFGMIAGTISPTVCAGDAITISASGANSYTWSTGATTASFSTVVSNTSTFTVEGDLQNNCKGSASFVVFTDLCTGISNNTLDTEWHIYPVPAKETIYFTASSEIKNAQVLNMFGESILESEGDIRSIDVSVLPQGVYFLRAGNSVKRFIKG